LRSNAPFARLGAALRERAVPARLSHDAGTYLCNYAYWRALERAARSRPASEHTVHRRILVQFVHIPPVRLGPRKRGDKKPALALPPLVAAAEALLVALIAASRR
jgi:pyroglutamyl-peptidase